MVIFNWKNIKELTGIVSSAKMDKTAVVVVKRITMHPLYKKRYTVEKKYYAHNELDAQQWAVVTLRQCRPLSKLKRRVITTIN